MAKKQISDVLIKFKGDHKGLDNAIGGSKSSLNRFASSARSAAGALIKIGAVGAIAMAGLTFASWKLTKSFADTGEQIDKVMKITGMGAQAIAGLTYAAEQEHISLETLEKGWKRLAKAMVDADDGLAESKRAFEGIGVSIYDTGGKLKSVEQMTYEMADAFSAMTDDTMKAGLAQDLFGRAGMEMIPFLDMGSKGIHELKEEYESLGFVWTDDMAMAAKAFIDKLTLMEYGFKALKLSIGQQLMPEFEKIVIWLNTNRDWMVTTFNEIFDIEVTNFGDFAVEQLDKVKAWIDANKGDIKWWVDFTKTLTGMKPRPLMGGEGDTVAEQAARHAAAASAEQAYFGRGGAPGGPSLPAGGLRQSIQISLDPESVIKFLSGQVVGVTNIATISGT